MTDAWGGPSARLTRAAQRTLDTASELFDEHGIHAVGVDRIALESGVTKKTLYGRFGSKENLASLRQREERWRGILAEHLEGGPRHARHPGLDSPIAAARAAARAMLTEQPSGRTPADAAGGCTGR